MQSEGFPSRRDQACGKHASEKQRGTVAGMARTQGSHAQAERALRKVRRMGGAAHE